MNLSSLSPDNNTYQSSMSVRVVSTHIGPWKINLSKFEDDFAGFEAQKWRLWWPFWIQMSSDNHLVNTHWTREEAIRFIDNNI